MRTLPTIVSVGNTYFPNDPPILYSAALSALSELSALPGNPDATGVYIHLVVSERSAPAVCRGGPYMETAMVSPRRLRALARVDVCRLNVN